MIGVALGAIVIGAIVIGVVPGTTTMTMMRRIVIGVAGIALGIVLAIGIKMMMGITIRLGITMMMMMIIMMMMMMIKDLMGFWGYKCLKTLWMGASRDMDTVGESDLY